MNKRVFLFICITVFSFLILWSVKNFNFFYLNYKIGQPIDSLNNVYVYYNGAINHTSNRNITKDGYNLGIKYQCVEFVKRYYYEHLGHKMPNTYGNAKDFFDLSINDGEKNSKRDLLQFKNPSKSKPKNDDLLVFDKNIYNPYGHVAIVSKVFKDKIEIIQQNPGYINKSREILYLEYNDGKWNIKNKRILGWLRKE